MERRGTCAEVGEGGEQALSFQSLFNRLSCDGAEGRIILVVEHVDMLCSFWPAATTAVFLQYWQCDDRRRH